MSHRMRVGAAATAMACGVLFALTEVVYFFALRSTDDLVEAASRPQFRAGAILALVTFALVIPTVLGIHHEQAERSGRFGAVAVTLACVGAVMMVGVAWTDAFVAPWLADLAPDALWSETPGGALAQGFIASRVLLGLGATLFGIATAMAGVYHRALGAGLVLSGLVAAVFTPEIGPGIIAGLSFLGLGLQSWQRIAASERAVMPAPPTAPAAPA